METRQIELVLKNADMIKSSISVAARLSGIAGIGTEGITTAMAIVVSDFLFAMAESLGIDYKQFTDDFFEAIREYMKEDEEKDKQ
jgi:hypothetical protein